MRTIPNERKVDEDYHRMVNTMAHGVSVIKGAAAGAHALGLKKNSMVNKTRKLDLINPVTGEHSKEALKTLTKMHRSPNQSPEGLPSQNKKKLRQIAAWDSLVLKDVADYNDEQALRMNHQKKLKKDIEIFQNQQSDERRANDTTNHQLKIRSEQQFLDRVNQAK